MNYVMLVQSTNKLVSATHSIYSKSDSRFILDEFSFQHNGQRLHGICQCACPLRSCKGETGEVIGLMGQQHMTSEVSN